MCQLQWGGNFPLGSAPSVKGHRDSWGRGVLSDSYLSGLRRTWRSTCKRQKDFDASTERAQRRNGARRGSPQGQDQAASRNGVRPGSLVSSD